MKNKTTTILLAFFLGGFGIHQFYLGQTKKGIFYLLFFWTLIPFLIAFIDLLIFATMSNEKFDEKFNKNSNFKPAEIYCANCKTKLTFMTTPNLGGGKLNDGGRICRECFGKIIKFDKGFGLNSSKVYSSEKVQQLLNPSEIKSDDVFKISSQSTNNNSSEITLDLDAEKLIPYMKQQQEKRDSEIKNFNYIPNQIQRQGFQLLESLSILNSTKNYDTLKGRFEFVEKFYDDFIKASYNKRYINDVQKSIDEYKSMYYDKILSSFEVSLILKPNHKELSSYYAECLMPCFNKFYNEQIQQIEILKRKEAIQKRQDKIIDVIDEIISELVIKGNNSNNYEKYNDELDRIREKTFNERYKNVS